jgi:hypothetical protein
MDLEDTGIRARFLIRDRDGKFPGVFDTVFNDAGIEVALSGVQMPKMNAVMERWVQTCRCELLDRTLIWKGAAGGRAARRRGTAGGWCPGRRASGRGIRCCHAARDHAHQRHDLRP